jgi:hypothetical protein
MLPDWGRGVDDTKLRFAGSLVSGRGMTIPRFETIAIYANASEKSRFAVCIASDHNNSSRLD